MSTQTQQFEFGTDGDAAVHRIALAPVLIGLSAPVVVLLLVEPSALTSASLLVQVYIYALFTFAVLIFILSSLEKGDVTRVTVEKSARRLLIERTGMLTKTVSELPFADIATIRMDVRSDADGYEIATPLIVLTTRDTVPLPVGTTESDIRAIRALMKN